MTLYDVPLDENLVARAIKVCRETERQRVSSGTFVRELRIIPRRAVELFGELVNRGVIDSCTHLPVAADAPASVSEPFPGAGTDGASPQVSPAFATTRSGTPAKTVKPSCVQHSLSDRARLMRKCSPTFGTAFVAFYDELLQCNKKSFGGKTSWDSACECVEMLASLVGYGLISKQESHL